MAQPIASMFGNEAVVKAAANAPITSAQALRAKAELQKMRSSLAAWLKYRRINDEIASGKPVPTPLLKRPGARRSPVAVFMLELHSQRASHEAVLAGQLYQLLAEVFDGDSLPEPNLAKNPNAAVELAQIAISGKLPGETAAPDAQGFVWLWPLVIVVGAIALVIMTAVRTNADAAMERERLECVKQGACTDSGFWIKLGAVAVVGWIVWDKMGVGKRVMSAVSSRRSRRAA